MPEIKWIKITSYMFEDEKIRLIDAIPNGVMVIYVWLRLLVQAGKINANGYIYLTENIPYTEEMLSTLFCKPLESIKFALKTLSDLEMIEVAPNNVIKIVNWDKHQNIEGMERVRAQNRKRAENHRDKKKQIEKTTEGNYEEGKQNDDDVNVEDKYDPKVQENQRENSNVSGGDNKNNNSSDIIEDPCNATENESNVIVTVQNKKEIENKNKKKREIESKNETGDINNKGSTHDEEVKESSFSKNEKPKEDSSAIVDDDINSKAVELMTYYEKITGVIGRLNYVSLKLAIDMHGENQVKMAIDKALEVNQTDMRYINGILKNWRREGYPKEGEVIKNGVRSTGKNNSADKNEFAGFKPKKPRNLTEAQRKGAEENLI